MRQRTMVYFARSSLIHTTTRFWSIVRTTSALRIGIIFLDNDRYGNPKKEKFGQFTASPTTIQYISVLSNLITYFGSLQGMDIVAIGDGYGGQAYIIQEMYNVKSYVSIDLYEAICLQERYVKELGFYIDTYRQDKYPKGAEYDLFLSNYALTEVSPEDQLKYVKDICLNCKRGYITANQPLHGIELLQERFRNFKILPDIEGERKSNFVIVWTE